MYSTVLSVHSWLRWVTLVLAIAATINAARAVRAADDRRAGRWDTLFMLAVDLQLFVGLVLYFGLSPFTREALLNLGTAMKTPALRFWAIEHAGGMFAAVILVRMGRVLAANAASPSQARIRRLVCFGCATAGMVVSIPWPGLMHGRPLFRL
jgi:hypothetical protein